MSRRARLSLNQITIDQWSLDEAVAGCSAAGVAWLGVWRHKLDGRALEESARTIRDSGLRVSSLCRGGFFTARDASERRERELDNLRAIEEAQTLGTDVLVLVCGPPADGDLRASRAAVAHGIERLVPSAMDAGVRLAIEPLHPMMLTERSVITTLAEASDLAERFDAATVGVIVDAYHVFWDAAVEQAIARAAGRILGFHISDWVTPRGDVLASRAMIGDGIVPLGELCDAVEAAGYVGPIEVEVIDAGRADQSGDEVLRLVVERFEQSLGG